MKLRLPLLYLLLFCSYFNTVFSSPKPLIKKVLIVIAMKEEADPLIKLLHFSASPAPDPSLPMKTYSGHYANLDIRLILNGKDPVHGVQNIGTQAAVLTTYLGLKDFHPDLILSVGTAGGRAEKGAKIGDIYISNTIYFHGRHLYSSDYKLYGIGGYQSMNTKSLVKKLNIKQGIFCSGDSFLEEKSDRLMQTKLGCTVIDMEAAGVSWVAMLKKIPMFAIKGITDYMSPSAHEEFEKNAPATIAALALKTREVLDLLSP